MHYTVGLRSRLKQAGRVVTVAKFSKLKELSKSPIVQMAGRAAAAYYTAGTSEMLLRARDLARGLKEGAGDELVELASS